MPESVSQTNLEKSVWLSNLISRMEVNISRTELSSDTDSKMNSIGNLDYLKIFTLDLLSQRRSSFTVGLWRRTRPLSLSQQVTVNDCRTPLHPRIIIPDYAMRRPAIVIPHPEPNIVWIFLLPWPSAVLKCGAEGQGEGWIYEMGLPSLAYRLASTAIAFQTFGHYIVCSRTPKREQAGDGSATGRSMRSLLIILFALKMFSLIGMPLSPRASEENIFRNNNRWKRDFELPL